MAERKEVGPVYPKDKKDCSFHCNPQKVSAHSPSLIETTNTPNYDLLTQSAKLEKKREGTYK